MYGDNRCNLANSTSSVFSIALLTLFLTSCSTIENKIYKASALSFIPTQ